MDMAQASTGAADGQGACGHARTLNERSSFAWGSLARLFLLRAPQRCESRTSGGVSDDQGAENPCVGGKDAGCRAAARLRISQTRAVTSVSGGWTPMPTPDALRLCSASRKR